MTTVAEVMTREVLFVSPTTPLRDVAARMIDAGVSGLPVVRDGQVIGVISETDLLAKEALLGEAAPGSLSLALSATRRHAAAAKGARTASGAMTAPAITTAPNVGVAAAARLMIERTVNRLPVVEDGRLVGIVTRSDLIRIFLRSDAELLDSIRREVLLDTLLLDPAAFTIRVNRGNVSINGSVPRRSLAEAVDRQIRRTPGVVTVSADLRWEVDDHDNHAEPRDYASPLTMR
jgi:CBS domain-containing protein